MYSGETPAGGRRLFGTSGLLFRSNKLMFDRSSYTLWSNLTGEPVVGRLAASPTELEVLPVVRSAWGDWREKHPDTTVTILDDAYGARWNFRYEPGAADRARAGVSFPVWQKSDALPPGEEVFAVRLEGGAKAYPVERVLSLRVINDGVSVEGGEIPLVVLGDRESGAVRVFRRGERTFHLDREGQLVDDRDRPWRIGEDRLIPADGRAGNGDGADPETALLERVPGHRSLWFAWYGFFPRTEAFGADEP